MTLLNRRTWIAAAAASAWGAHTGPLAAATWDHLKTLPRTARMPVLFLGHGSPMNAIEDNTYRRSWQALGADFGSKYPRPHLVLCVSAHWLTQGWWLTGMANPKTIHDFGGFRRPCSTSVFPRPVRPLQPPRSPGGSPVRDWFWTPTSGGTTTARGRS